VFRSTASVFDALAASGIVVRRAYRVKKEARGGLSAFAPVSKMDAGAT